MKFVSVGFFYDDLQRHRIDNKLDEVPELEDHDDEHEDKDDDALDIAKLDGGHEHFNHCHRVGHIALHRFNLTPCNLSGDTNNLSKRFLK